MAGVTPLLFTPVLPYTVLAPNTPAPGGAHLCPLPYLLFKHPPEATNPQAEGFGSPWQDYSCCDVSLPRLSLLGAALWAKNSFCYRKALGLCCWRWAISPRLPFQSVYFVPPQARQFLCTENFTFFYILRGDNGPYGALKCHVSIGVAADNTICSESTRKAWVCGFLVRTGDCYLIFCIFTRKFVEKKSIALPK